MKKKTETFSEERNKWGRKELLAKTTKTKVKLIIFQRVFVHRKLTVVKIAHGVGAFCRSSGIAPIVE